MSSKERPQLKRPVPPRAKSVSSKPPHPQTRTRKTHPLSSTSTVYKANSDSSLLNGLRKLRIQDDKTGNSASSSGAIQPVRRRLSSAGLGCKNLQDIAQFIVDKKAKNIVVMAGAGISTPSGIPDFRTPGTGLYDNIKQYNIPYPEAIFDIDYFESYPRPFYTLAKELYPNGTYPPNYIHYFLKLLNDKGILLRIYTQNIDGLERIAGIPAQKLVEAHGNFLSVSCIRCKQQHDAELIKKAIYADRLPRCMKNGCTALVKPDIVFFGEDLPRRFYYYLKDFPQADLLLVMGTSLEVEPFAGILDSVRFYVPRVLFNRNVVGPFLKKRRANDVVSKGDIIDQLKVLVALLGWDKDLQQLMADQKTNQSQDSEKSPDKQTANDKEIPPAEINSSGDNNETASRMTEKQNTTTSNTAGIATGPNNTTTVTDHSNTAAIAVVPSNAVTTTTASAMTKTGISRHKQSPNSVKTSSFSRRPPIPNGTTSTNRDLSVMKQMVRLNADRNRRVTVTNRSDIGHDQAALPRIGPKYIPFHTQRALFRTDNPRLMRVDTSSDEDSSTSSDSDD